MPVDLKEAVLARVDLVELARQYISVIQAGRDFKARCPFHEEKTPSFHITPEKGLFHCFGCKAGGNAIDFVMRIENLEFRDALEWLARRYNIDIEQYRPHGEHGAAAPVGGKERLYKLNEAAGAFFRAQLRSPAGGNARRYLARRGVNERLIDEFDLGYAPREWQALTDIMLGQGAKAAELTSLGLIKPRGGAEGGPAHAGAPGGGHYDAFRDRLIFPVRSVTGRIIGFAGRALSDEDSPKYLNVTNTPLYDKSKVLYNLDRAKGFLRDEGAVVVEGYMDVIGLASAGVYNTVASCGTAMTADHIRLIARYTERFYLAFDGDEAGRNAAWGVGKLFLLAGLDARVLPLPAGVDPDELMRDKGAEAWTGLLQNSASVVRFWLEHQLSLHPQPDPGMQRRWVAQLSPLYRQLPDPITRQVLKQEVAGILRLGAADVEGLLSGEAPVAQARSQDPKAALSHSMRQRALMQGASPIEREVLRRLAQDEELRLVYSVQEQMEPYIAAAQWFADPLLREVYTALQATPDPDSVLRDERYAALFAELFAAEPLQDDNEQLLHRHRNYFIDQLIERHAAAQRERKAAGDIDGEMEEFRRVQELKSYIVRVRGLEQSPGRI
jgi:DNA primase